MSLGKLKYFVAASWLLISPAFAQDEAELLDRLKSATETEGQQIERELVLIWSRSGSSSMDLLLERGRRAINSGDYRAAIDHLTALTDHAPDFAEGWNARAIAYFHAGLYGPSIADIGQVLALNPNHFGAMAGLAAMLEEMGEFEKALDMLYRIEAIHPSRPGLSQAIERLEDRTGSTL